jgi:hypothetical protein
MIYSYCVARTTRLLFTKTILQASPAFFARAFDSTVSNEAVVYVEENMLGISSRHHACTFAYLESDLNCVVFDSIAPPVFGSICVM